MDSRARRILFNSYWRNGWLSEEERDVSPEDFAYAKHCGVMFEAVVWRHDDSVDAVQSYRTREWRDAASAAFVASLSNRRLDWRSALASQSMIECLPDHDWTPEDTSLAGIAQEPEAGLSVCRICRLSGGGYPWELTSDETSESLDLSLFNFERIKWGGVRHDVLDYVRFDLTQFASEMPEDPDGAGLAVLEGVLSTVRSCSPETTASSLAVLLKAVVPGTASELRSLVELLGWARVLVPSSTETSPSGRSDWTAPAVHWRGSDRYDEERVRELFPLSA